MKNITVETYREGNEKELNELFNIVFKKNRDLKEWEWKYKECPIDARSFIILAKDEDKIVGQFPSMVYFLKYQDKRIKMAQVVDSIVHEDYRGGTKGVLVEMVLKEEEKYYENGIEFALGYPTPEHYFFGKRVLKYLDLIQVENLFKRLSWRLPIKNRFPIPFLYHWGGWISSTLIKFFIKFSLKSIKGVQYRWVHTFDEKVDAFWKTIQQQYGIWVVRDWRYLDWRYCKKPLKDYHILVAERERSILGILIVKYEDHNDIRVGFIMESLATQEIPILEHLIKRGLILLARHKVDHVFVRLSALDPLRDLFKKIGFTSKESEWDSNIIYKKYSSHLEDSILRDSSLWHMSFGDCDSL